MFGKYQKNALATIDELQIQLTEQYITPHVDDFEKALYALREVMDELWLSGDTDKLVGERKLFLQEQIQKHKQKIGNELSKLFPWGRCYNITVITYDYLLRFEINDTQSAFFPLKEFIQQGGVFKVIWGEVRHEVFQTSMQIGNWYFDAANDTVIITKPKVLKFTFDSPQNEFYDVSSVQQYADIKRKYNECDIYFNHLFPSVNKLFPLLIVKNNRISIGDSQHLADLMVMTNFSFLTQHSLPEFSIKQMEILRTKLLKNDSLNNFPWLKNTDVDFIKISHKEVYKAVQQINFALSFVELSDTGF